VLVSVAIVLLLTLLTARYTPSAPTPEVAESMPITTSQKLSVP
jgi:hypothetical protein